MIKNSVYNNIVIKIGDKVRFKYANNLVIGIVTDKYNSDYVVIIETINGSSKERGKVVLVNIATILNYLFNK